MDMNFSHGNDRSQKGFTLLLAALIASIVLSLGTSIFQLAQKELTLSSIGRDSQFAFYAADTGAECALYWDVRYQSFPTSTPRTADISCDDQNKTTTVTTVGSDIVSSFQFAPNGYCVNVSVSKAMDAGTGAVATTVHADGFSTNCEAVATSPRALQRSVELKY
ncbi:hypothetical protein A3F28_00790 [Candidatus Uhrbacteria bacterium RIFCSPHIGHO2_12_FULL_57_11]|uniref:Type 4 fimbrial biogenesis protein PilX N-terminal domain-containing protein n=2 Tax=Parcubacteria group TaxID=1794811 RepID=A0A1F6EI10_9BACT|nr:MAG: hypothetical protein A3A40_03005 [Candidatus Kaiserbacteria bacterium RIFCSPLOWO2_01_FULL_54_20]OGL78507.1 MAG: hypothetical protein A3F28_00790 [Candidatus Uhrbacteria bacterium RIFCSPHIGHO2_12_FULL_57_11]